MSNTIKIGQPFISHFGDKVRLCSKISRPSGEFELYYELPLEYEKYLCTERSNSFVLGILEYAMYMRYDIESDTPIDEALHYQLTNYGTNILSDNLTALHNIKINIPFTADAIKSDNAVGTGFSAGVDSFYTVLKHLNPKEKNYKLTHLLIVNNGAFTYAETKNTEKLFYEQVKTLSPAAYELGLPLIPVNTNYNDFYMDANVKIEYIDHILAGTPLKIAACVYAMQKLFSVYYMGSAVQLKEFGFIPTDPGFVLLYYLKLFSIPNMNFYGSGTEVTRMEKVRYICGNHVVRKYLSVDLGKNCSGCAKCLRTMFELYALNQLDHYNKVFDIDSFKNHLSNKIGSYMSLKNEKIHGFTQETVNMCKKNNVKIPAAAYIKCWFFYMPFNFVKSKLKKSNAIRKLYYKFDLDIKLYGEASRAWRSSYFPEDEI